MTQVADTFRTSPIVTATLARTDPHQELAQA
jgi:hypothetical protein